MTNDEPEFDFVEGKRKKEEGMAKARGSPSAIQWNHDVGRWFMLLPVGTTFTMDDVIRANGLPSEGGANKQNAVGAWINGMARARFIQKTGRIIKSERVKRHAGEANEWVKIK